MKSDNCKPERETGPADAGKGKTKVVCPHKKTDFRYQLWLQERKTLHERAKRRSFRVEPKTQATRRDAVTIDTSKARSNLDVLRLCLQELGYREVGFAELYMIQ